MYYELYVDSLFLINFVMNLYLLILVDRSLLRTATRKRLILGAAAGAVAYLLPFLSGLPVWIKFPLCILAGTALMIRIAFQPKTVKAYGKIVEKLLLYSFLMGGLLLFLNEMPDLGRRRMMGIWKILGGGALGFLGVTYLQEKQKQRKNKSSCTVTLIRGDRQVIVTALIDSGNRLVEPVSGKPVSIVDTEIYRTLWGEEQLPYRAVPYHSIGRKRGILKGFLLPELKIEMDGMVKSVRDVYIAVMEEQTKEVKMILNPAVSEYVL